MKFATILCLVLSATFLNATEYVVSRGAISWEIRGDNFVEVGKFRRLTRVKVLSRWKEGPKMSLVETSSGDITWVRDADMFPIDNPSRVEVESDHE